MIYFWWTYIQTSSSLVPADWRGSIRWMDRKSWTGGSVGWSILPYMKNVVGSIPTHGTYLGCGFDSWLGRLWEATNQCFSLTLMFLSLPAPLSKINKYILRWGLKKKSKDGKIRVVIKKKIGCGLILVTAKALSPGWRMGRGKSMPYHNYHKAHCFSCTTASFFNTQSRTDFRRDKQLVSFMIVTAYNPNMWFPSWAR